MTTRDHYEVLGLPRAYHVSAGELEKRYHALSKELHPDRFAKAQPRERLQAVSRSTDLNDAYRVLRDDVKRAEYLLKLEGLDVADERSSVKPDPALLGEMMELNEALDDSRAKELAADVEARRTRALSGVSEWFKEYEAGDRSSLAKIAQALIAARYYARFLERAAGDVEEL